MEESDLLATWRRLLIDSYTSWVLFAHGTCVVLDQPGDDPATRAAALLREFGPVHIGTDSADFNVVAAPGGRLITCYRPDILVFVAAAEVPPEQDDLIAGLVGRARREQDAAGPVARHVEVSRSSRPPCACLEAPGTQLAARRALGMDKAYGEATVLVCRLCGRRWLRYFYENEAITGSGRWYLGHIPAARGLGITAGEARQTLASLDWYHTGGSTFEGRTGRGAGQILL